MQNHILSSLKHSNIFVQCLNVYWINFWECCVVFKQITAAGATTAAVTEKVWGEYVSVVCQILRLASKAKYKDERNIGWGV